MLLTQISFYVLAVVAVASALGVVLFRNAVYSMLSLILNLLSLAAFFLTLESMFVATIQVLIYAGAVMVLFLFVVTMLSPGNDDDVAGRNRLAWQWGAGAGLAVILAGGLILAVLNGALSRDARAMGLNGLSGQLALLTVQNPGQGVGSTELFGLALFHGFSFPFEVTSVLLVIAVLGAVVLGRRITGRE
jgi:NADH-quinone oxidoreductase subunit J